MKLNYKIIINFVGILLIFNGACMALSSLVSLYYGESVQALLLSSAISLIVGALCWVIMKNAPKGLKKKEGYLIVTSVWVFISLSGMLPYLISGTIPDLSLIHI